MNSFSLVKVIRILFKIKMSVTREFSRDIYTEISEFGIQFVNDDYLSSFGWNAVPVIEVKNANECVNNLSMTPPCSFTGCPVVTLDVEFS